jgi:nicotinate phosphoribosyltransferase
MIITSLLDNDLYKFFMHWYSIKYGENDIVEFSFINRGKTKFSGEMYTEIKQEIHDFIKFMKLDSCELSYLRFLNLFPSQYLTYLKYFNLKNSSVDIDIRNISGNLSLSIKGYWHDCTLLEVPLMAIISEVYNKYNSTESSVKSLTKASVRALNKKVFLENKVSFSEFGTRRRYSKEVQKQINQIYNCSTSNLLIGMTQNKPVVGTQPHELYMYEAAKNGYEKAYHIALDRWKETFKNSHTILTDTFSSDAFFSTFKNDPILGEKLSFRQDSGSPLEYIDLVTKTFSKKPVEIIFSDGLNMNKVSKILGYLRDKPWITPKFGIGTNLTNDIEGVEPLNIVIKLTKVNDKETIKISDSPGKYLGPAEEINKCLKELNITLL